MIQKLLCFRGYLKPYRLKLGLLGCLLLGTMLTESLGVGLFYPLVEYIQRGDAFLQQGAARKLFDLLSVLGLTPSVGLFILLIFVVILTTLTLKWAVFAFSAWIADALMKDLRDKAFHNILHAHIFHFYSSSSASFAQTIEAEAEYVGRSLNFVILTAANALSIVVFTAFLFIVSWSLTLLVAFIAALRYAVSGIFIRKVRVIGSENGLIRTQIKSLLTAIHQGIDVVKCFGTEAWETARFSHVTSRLRDNADSIAAVQAGNTFFEGLLGDGLLCVFVYLAVSTLNVSGAALLTFLFIITRIIPKVTNLNDARIHIAEYMSYIDVLPKALEDGGLPALSWGDSSKPRLEDRIVFEDVSFVYPGAEAPALTGAHLVLRKGESLALLGESGAGKSTLARLLLRLFDPTSGRILVDGVPLPDLRREDWTRLVSVVSQETFIFDDTLENNVRYGSPDCTEEAFRSALRRARATDFVEAMPEKERTQVGERGVKLSGGQRQRIAIARAFLRGSPILILDEATSAMDAVTEKLIQDAIDDLAKTRTTLVIAHRFTTIRGADRIVVLDGGRVAETGTHEELLAHGRLYRNYHELQTR